MNLRAYAEFIADIRPVVWIGDCPWSVDGRVLQPLAPPHSMGVVERSRVRHAMRRTGAYLARWNEGWDMGECEWWYICCDDHQYDLAKLSHNRRRNINKALRRTEVRRVDMRWFAENAFEVYYASFSRYGIGAAPGTREVFVRGALRAAQCAAVEAWGAFCEGKMIAYMTCLCIDDICLISGNKWDPRYRSAQANDALEYTLTRHYLVDRGMRYVSTGARVVHHETDTQEYDLTFGYRRVFCPLRVELSLLTKAVVRSGVATWGKHVGLWNLAPHTMRNIQAVTSLMDIARLSSNVAVDG
jgi:hypothetical protein